MFPVYFMFSFNMEVFVTLVCVFHFLALTFSLLDLYLRFRFGLLRRGQCMSSCFDFFFLQECEGISFVCKFEGSFFIFLKITFSLYFYFAFCVLVLLIYCFLVNSAFLLCTFAYLNFFLTILFFFLILTGRPIVSVWVLWSLMWMLMWSLI